MKDAPTALTFFFSDIFPDYDTWRALIQDNNVIDYTDNENLIFDQFVYKILYRRFALANIRYDTKEAFYLALFNVYEDRFEQYKKEKSFIDSLYNLSQEDFKILSESITNAANNPNTKPTDPWKPIEFISNQNSGRQYSGAVAAYLSAIESLPTFNINKFITARYNGGMSFQDLFMQVIPNQQYIYFEED